MESKLVHRFLELIAIDSESGEEAQFIAFLKQELEHFFAAACRIDSFGNLIAAIPAKNSDQEEPILLGVHADTVKPGKNIRPVLDRENGVIRTDGSTVLGADDKAGIAEILEAISTADRHPPLELVVTVQEEVGTLGARHLDTSALRSKIGFVLDMDAIDAIVVGGPSHMLIDIEITGKSAHAGMDPEHGISALKAACQAVSTLKEGWIDEETTMNVGVLHGGEIRNGVPEKAYVKAECRSLTHEKCLQQATIVRSAFEAAAQDLGATAVVREELSSKAVHISESSATVKLAEKALVSAGLTPKTMVICGGTDASHLNEKGIETVVLGMGSRLEHTKNEHIFINDMEKAVRMVRYLLQNLAQ